MRQEGTTDYGDGVSSFSRGSANLCDVLCVQDIRSWVCFMRGLC
jgi:hypothetical protein